MVITSVLLSEETMNKYEIEDVLPHQSPMILIDEILSYDEDTCSCAVTISSSSPFFCAEAQGVPTYIGSEYMAQAIAAFAGAQALDKNEQVSIGFLLGSRKFKTTLPYFAKNQKISILVKELYREDSGLRVFDCQLTDQENNAIAQANINVFQPDDAEQFLNESI